MLKDEIKKIVEVAAKNLGFKFNSYEILVAVPTRKDVGDYFTNAPHVLAGKSREPIQEKNIRRIAPLLKAEIEKTMTYEIAKVEDIGGFLNFYLSKEFLQVEIKNILKEKNKYGNGKNKKEKINVEFISANPTGPLTLGNGRGGFCGDTLANVFKKNGYKVEKEYYVNDTGNQINKLGHSVIGDELAEYKGEYIEELRKKMKSAFAKASADEVGEKAGKEILEKMIKPSVKKMGVKFDNWFSEKSLYKKGEIDKIILELKNKNFTYESEGALWFKSTELGDDKDRVLVRADGQKTYFASDVAYLKNKFERKFDNLIFFVGADHHGYIARLKAAATALGYDKEKIKVIVLQLVKLFENGKEVRMSKRTGIYVTIDELINEVGLDVARFFFLQISPNTHMNFNLDLAKEKSEKNPVFKVQYAHARICSILAKSEIRNPKSETLNLLKEQSELNLIKELIKFSEIIEETAKNYQVQKLPQYAMDLADAFHKFYENCKVISDDKNLTNARMGLILATKIVLENTLNLMGVSAPEKM